MDQKTKLVVDRESCRFSRCGRTDKGVSTRSQSKHTMHQLPAKHASFASAGFPCCSRLSRHICFFRLFLSCLSLVWQVSALSQVVSLYVRSALPKDLDDAVAEAVSEEVPLRNHNGAKTERMDMRPHIHTSTHTHTHTHAYTWHQINYL
jgi:tRNA U38,U39,U40 pseudouridine synthase TruA